MIEQVYCLQCKEEIMKKIIRDRIIFAVVACIAMAGIIFFCHTQQSAPIHMPEEIRSIMGEEADASFSLYFSELENWYASQTLVNGTVTLSGQDQYDEMCRPLEALNPFLTACGQVTDMEAFAKVEEYLTPMSMFTLIYFNAVEEFYFYGSYTFAAEDWSAMGTALQNMTDYYRAQ